MDFQLILAMGIVAVALVGAFAAQIWFLIVSFKVHWGWPLAMFLTGGGLVSILFTVLNWEDAKRPFMVGLVSCGIGFLGLSYAMSVGLTEENMMKIAGMAITDESIAQMEQAMIEADVPPEEREAMLAEMRSMQESMGKPSIQDPEIATYEEAVEAAAVESQAEVAVNPQAEPQAAPSSAPLQPRQRGVFGDDLDSYIGITLREIRRWHGQPIAKMENAQGDMMLLYPGIEIISRDGETVYDIKHSR